MDFFAAQERARRASRWLLFWFFLAVALCVGIIYLALALPLAGEGGSLWQPGLFFLVTLGVGGTILIGSAWKGVQLAAGGGAFVAESLGGRRVARTSADPAERRLLNLAEEMAIAAGIPVPPVYVLDDEAGINAFAAGTRPQEAVVAVTRGALEKLGRDELQGVMAHEFSHILNGDMRLNLRLLSVLHGLFMLATAGRLILHSVRSGAGRNRGGLVLLGLALVIAGFLGVLAGRLIRAAVSRQREYLADAAAVQFTRNPDGIAGALRKIAREALPIENPQAEEASHMLFDAGGRFAGWLATHPPLSERIRRIEGRSSRMKLPEAAVAPASTLGEDGAAAGFAPAAPAPTPQAYAERVGAPDAAALDAARGRIVSLPESLRAAVATPAGAQAAVLALFLSRDAGQRQIQLDLLAQHIDPAFAGQVATALPRDFGPGLRLPLIELALGSLRELKRSARQSLVDGAQVLATADGRVTISEYLLLRLVRDALTPAAPPPMLTIPGGMTQHGALILSLMAHAGSRQPDEVTAAFARGAAHAPVDGLALLPVSELRTEALDRALETLALATPPYRKRFVAALAAVAWHDSRIEPAEAELLAAICGALDCPVPAAAPAAPEKISAGETAGMARIVAADLAAPATAPQDRRAAPPPADGSVTGIVITNLVTLAIAVWQDWSVLQLLWPFWMQSVIIGGYARQRILKLTRFSTEGFKINDRPVDPTAETRRLTANFFALHYGLFHLVYFFFLAAFTLTSDPQGFIDVTNEDTGELMHVHIGKVEPIDFLIYLGLAIGFFVSHGRSHEEHVRADLGNTPNIGHLMGLPYLRIVPMHLCIILAIPFGGGAIWFFMLLKTVADVAMHKIEHRLLQGPKAARPG